MQFEWDQNKNELNIQKHQIDFEGAKLIFTDANRIIYQDLRNDYGEERFKAIGIVYNIYISVIYTIRNPFIRIISARKANKRERTDYIDKLRNK